MNDYEQELIAERRAKMRRALTALIVIVVLAGAAYGVYSMTIGRQILKGETTLDFDVIEFDIYGGVVEDQFELVNSLNSPLTIAKVIPSCGCTTVESGPWTVGPGETWMLPVKFEISKTGLKEADIKVVLEDRGVQTLWVRGIGRDKRLLSSAQANGFVLRPGLPSIISIRAAVYDGPEPPPLDVTGEPENVEVHVIGWERSPVQRQGKHEPVLWVTQVEIRQNGGDVVKDAPITFTARGTDQSITIPINGEIPANAVEGTAVNR